MKVDIDNGHYTVAFDEQAGRLSALRYGQEWRDCTGDNLLLLMAMEVDRLRDQVMDLRGHVHRLEESDAFGGKAASKATEYALHLERELADLRQKFQQLEWRKGPPDRIGMWVYRHDNFGFAIVRCDEVTDDVSELTWFDTVPQGDWDGDWKLLEEEGT
jgi:hypothetical protein